MTTLTNTNPPTTSNKTYSVRWKNGKMDTICGISFTDALQQSEFGAESLSKVDTWTEIVLQKPRVCVICQKEFTIDPSHESWYLSKGLLLPRRCPRCLEKKRKETGMHNMVGNMHKIAQNDITSTTLHNIIDAYNKEQDKYMSEYGEIYQSGDILFREFIDTYQYNSIPVAPPDTPSDTFPIDVDLVINLVNKYREMSNATLSILDSDPNDQLAIGNIIIIGAMVHHKIESIEGISKIWNIDPDVIKWIAENVSIYYDISSSPIPDEEDFMNVMEMDSNPNFHYGGISATD